jgi:hypothetical protein
MLPRCMDATLYSIDGKMKMDMAIKHRCPEDELHFHFSLVDTHKHTAPHQLFISYRIQSFGFVFSWRTFSISNEKWVCPHFVRRSVAEHLDFRKLPKKMLTKNFESQVRKFENERSENAL